MVQRCIWIENPHIKIGILVSSLETPCLSISMSTILNIGSTVRKALIIERLQARFDGNIMTHLG